MHLVPLYFPLQAEPLPDITWLKDDEPVDPWINIINVEGASTLSIPSSKRSDSGVYTITAKNSSGSACFDVEVRVTGEHIQNQLHNRVRNRPELP